MIILGIDPGNQQSAFVRYDTETRKPGLHETLSNSEVLPLLSSLSYAHLAIEMVACYGMPVGASVFDTCVWIGRFTQVAVSHFRPVSYIYRREEKMLLCGNMKAKDGNIRQALMDRYGSTREAAIGTKKTPGPLYGFAGDQWAALAVAITFSEKVH